MRDQVKEVQALTENHGEALLGASDRLAQLETEIRDLEGLVDAVQGIAAKQLKLLSSVIGQGARKAPVVGNTSKKSSSSTVGENKIKKKSSVTGVVKGDKPLTANDEVSNSGKDEWGRAVVAQSLRNKKEQEEKKVGNEKSGVGAARAEEKPPAEVTSIDDGGQMKLNDDGSVSFSF